MLFYGFFLLYLPELVGYALAVVSLVFMLRLWRHTRNVGFALLAFLAVLGIGMSLATPSIVSVLGVFRSRIFFAWWYPITSGLIAFAWWRIYLHRKAPPTDDV